MQFAAAEPFPNRTRLRLRFRRHRRQGIDPKFFDSWSRNGVLEDQSREVPVTSTTQCCRRFISSDVTGVSREKSARALDAGRVQGWVDIRARNRLSNLRCTDEGLSIPAETVTAQTAIGLLTPFSFAPLF